MIHVVAAALIDGAGRTLIAQRPPGKHLAGGWEFPGGKLEPGEQRRAGLARELREELGIEIGMARPLLRVKHTYAYGEVLIDMWVVREYRGEPRGLDGQALRWCSPAELAEAQLLPADEPIVAALRLPERLTSLDQAGLQGRFCSDAAGASAAVSAGADFLVLREPIPDDQLKALCEAVAVPVYARGLSMEEAWRRGATGIASIR